MHQLLQNIFIFAYQSSFVFVFTKSHIIIIDFQIIMQTFLINKIFLNHPN